MCSTRFPGLSQTCHQSVLSTACVLEQYSGRAFLLPLPLTHTFVICSRFVLSVSLYWCFSFLNCGIQFTPPLTHTFVICSSSTHNAIPQATGPDCYLSITMLEFPRAPLSGLCTDIPQKPCSFEYYSSIHHDKVQLSALFFVFGHAMYCAEHTFHIHKE